MPNSANPDSSTTTSLIRWNLRLLAGVALGIGGGLVLFPDRTDRWGSPVAWMRLAFYLFVWPFLLIPVCCAKLNRRQSQEVSHG